MSTSLNQQLLEYESQLADVNEMLSADPNDESLLNLKRDLEELIALTKSDAAAQDSETSARGSESENENDATYGSSTEDTNVPIGTGTDAMQRPLVDSTNATSISKSPPPGNEDGTNPAEEEPATTAAADDDNNTSKKSSTKSNKPPPSKFEIPDHLLPLETDTETERNRKRRTIKALKSKWRERVKEVAGAERQKSWQDFVSKKKRKRVKGLIKNESIFRTEEGQHARVGVIGSGKGMTEFEERKRFKQK